MVTHTIERDEFPNFVQDVRETLTMLAGALREGKLVLQKLPDLREDHHRLLQAAGPGLTAQALVYEETDRMTNSLNTLRDQVLSWEHASDPAETR